MDFTGRYAIPASPEVVWAALNNPDVLKTCITGCESLIKTDATHYAAIAILKIGPVKATFRAEIEQTDLDPPHRCVLRGEGQGGVAGFARGEAEVVLTPEADGTRLSYTAKASIGGKLAQIGQRLIDGAARQIADEFFSRFVSIVSASAASQTKVAEEPAAAPFEVAAPEPITMSKREGLAPEIWVAGLIGVIAILLILFGLVLRLT
jgi:carbon monoxide dehydrogenase subunit G